MTTPKDQPATNPPTQAAEEAKVQATSKVTSAALAEVFDFEFVKLSRSQLSFKVRTGLACS